MINNIIILKDSSLLYEDYLLYNNIYYAYYFLFRYCESFNFPSDAMIAICKCQRRSSPNLLNSNYPGLKFNTPIIIILLSINVFIRNKQYIIKL